MEVVITVRPLHNYSTTSTSGVAA